MSKQLITVSTTNFDLINAPVSELGQATYEADIAGIPPMYRPRIDLTSTPNASKTNRNWQFTIKVPVVKVNSATGLPEAKNIFAFTGKFTALQNVDEADLRLLTINAAIAFLTEYRLEAAEGRTK